MDRVGIGIIGCGNISSQYLRAAGSFPILEIKAIADINMEVAKARGAEFGVPVKTVADLLADETIEIVVNLTVPLAHVEVGLQVIAAGKHVHSEKPLGVTVAEARKLIDAARARNLRIGCAPDTFLGGAHQTCRKLLDEGAIGQPIAGTAVYGTAGHERWHPSPEFYYLPGGGPVLDMGPYYVTALVNLLGPVKKVAAVTSRVRKQRTISSEPKKGQVIPVQVDTHAAGTLVFHNGTVISVVLSFDIARYRHAPIELYGAAGVMGVPDPNFFDGEILLATATEDWHPTPIQHGHAEHNLRIMGVADMAHAIRKGRPHRASGDLAFHVLEVMEGFQRSSDSGKHVRMTTRPARPAMMPVGLKTGEFD
ncbi:MAG TPA: Gfo/Idh/MocA family oxidoreductase [Bauldia sp.]|nr:Gfo/Idh/MocA family oxidoreductase [Bauldia sp.]